MHTPPPLEFFHCAHFTSNWHAIPFWPLLIKNGEHGGRKVPPPRGTCSAQNKGVLLGAGPYIVNLGSRNRPKLEDEQKCLSKVRNHSSPEMLRIRRLIVQKCWVCASMQRLVKQHAHTAHLMARVIESVGRIRRSEMSSEWLWSMFAKELWTLKYLM